MFLRKIQIPGVEILGFKTQINLPLECKNCLFGVFPGKRQMSIAKSLGIKFCQLIADFHQLFQFLWRVLFQYLDQLTGMIQKIRVGVLARG